MSGPVTINPRVAAILLHHLPARRLRVKFRADSEVWSVLYALAECAVMSDDGQEIAIENAAGWDRRVTVSQAARRARVSARTIVRAVHDGHLEADRFGPVWQISERSLARYMAGRQAAGRQARERTSA